MGVAQAPGTDREDANDITGANAPDHDHNSKTWPPQFTTYNEVYLHKCHCFRYKMNENYVS